MTVQMSAVLAKEHVEIYKAVFGVNVFPITMGNCVRTVRVFLFDILESVFLSHYEKSNWLELLEYGSYLFEKAIFIFSLKFVFVAVILF